mmetsp:Transcript_4872/g.10744  ORF Transcript_4872/g.10744 Transcript_4872/m.10744 type:complete len:351 (+) Transcript_4872:3-1055(+)
MAEVATAEVAGLDESIAQLSNRANALLRELQDLDATHTVDGTDKILRKLQAENVFIDKMQQRMIPVTKSRVQSTNLGHFEAILAAIRQSSSVVAIHQWFNCPRRDCQTIKVDVVADGGATWVEVVTMPPHKLRQFWVDARPGQTDMKTHVQQLIATARQNPHFYRTPKIVLFFHCGVLDTVRDRLGRMGVSVSGEVITDSVREWESDSDSDSEEGEEQHVGGVEDDDHESGEVSDLSLVPKDLAVNLDVTTLINLVSEISHGGEPISDANPFLTAQYAEERVRPLLPKLQALLEGRRLIACESAVRDFKAIVTKIGGTVENRRADELLTRVEVVGDSPPGKFQSLVLTGK